MEKTLQQYDDVIQECQELFNHKLKDYGTAWRIMRLPSLTDQIYIKANRIRSIQENKIQKIEEDIRSEFIGIINYAAIALIQMDLGVSNCADLSIEKAIDIYKEKVGQAKQLMQNKNHDYGEAWRDMRISSMTDLILQKLLRIKQIEDNAGKTIVSEGLDANYLDILNYAVFSMIQLNELEEL